MRSPLVYVYMEVDMDNKHFLKKLLKSVSGNVAELLLNYISCIETFLNFFFCIYICILSISCLRVLHGCVRVAPGRLNN